MQSTLTGLIERSIPQTFIYKKRVQWQKTLNFDAKFGAPRLRDCGRRAAFCVLAFQFEWLKTVGKMRFQVGLVYIPIRNPIYDELTCDCMHICMFSINDVVSSVHGLVQLIQNVIGRFPNGIIHQRKKKCFSFLMVRNT